MKKTRIAIAVAIALAAPAAVMAQESASTMPSVSFSGFGTAGVVRTNTDLAQYETSVLQQGGAGRKADFGVDSLIGGQVNVKAMDKLSFVGQVVANRTADADYKPHVEWAFGRYAITGDLSVRGGIMAVPVYMLSDSRLVGFSYQWVRTPTALYSQVPFTNFRGVDVVYRKELGGVNVTVQPYYGKAPTNIPDATTGGHATVELDRLMGVNLVAEKGAWTARAGYLQTQLTYHSKQIDTLFGGLRQVAPFIPGAAALADSLSSVDKRMTFAGVGLGYESGNLLAQAEYGKRKSNLFLASTSSWYATAGYRFGSFTPHLTISEVKTDSATSQSVVPTVGPFAALGGGINTLLAGQNPAQKTVAAGVRYQFAKNADLKLQWDRIKLPTGAVGNFTLPKPGFVGSTVNVYSAAVDFVF